MDFNSHSGIGPFAVSVKLIDQIHTASKVHFFFEVQIVDVLLPLFERLYR